MNRWMFRVAVLGMNRWMFRVAVLGMNRWMFRVAAYAGLKTDTYPPFRLDMGGHEPPSRDAASPVGQSPAPTAV